MGPWKPLDHAPLRNPLVPDVRITAWRSRRFYTVFSASSSLYVGGSQRSHRGYHCSPTWSRSSLRTTWWLTHLTHPCPLAVWMSPCLQGRTDLPLTWMLRRLLSSSLLPSKSRRYVLLCTLPNRDHTHMMWVWNKKTASNGMKYDLYNMWIQ